MVSLLTLGCAKQNLESSESEESKNSISESTSSSSSAISSSEVSSDNSSVISDDTSSVPSSSSSKESSTSSSRSSSSSSSKSSSSTSLHIHEWSTEWAYNDSNHWHECSGCNNKNDNAAHTFGASQKVNLGERLNDSRYQHSTITVKACSACGYEKIEDEDILPKVYFQSDNPSEINFATIAKSTDTDRPVVAGKLTINNCGTEYQKTDLVCEMKVRGNQTAGFPKKGLRIKLNKGDNLLGLNGGKKFKKWVLMADAKDSCIIRTSIGLSVAKDISVGENIFVSDFTPVSVYLNGTYWGYYLLAEQKETKTGRINLPVPEGKTTVDIGYNFELDHYAESEPNKADGGDPTFSLDYGDKFTNRSYSIESSLANPGPMKNYTMNSDIYDGPEGVALNPNNSNQVKFIRDRLQALFEVLYQAAIKNKAYTISNDLEDPNYNKAVEASGKTVRQAIEENFDLNTWACGFIINAFSCPPDLGYSSFYMSFDNSAEGAKKLRYDNPWDFDSNFGNRNNFITSADSASSSGGWGGSSYDPYYMDRTSNMWLQYLNKLDFFINEYVKPKWNQARENQVFEKMFKMIRNNFKYYDYEARKNFQKWPEIKAQDGDNVGTYFSGELRDVFKSPSRRLEAQTETINWCAKRVNYLEKRWGNNRPNVDTGA